MVAINLKYHYKNTFSSISKKTENNVLYLQINFPCFLSPHGNESYVKVKLSKKNFNYTTTQLQLTHNKTTNTFSDVDHTKLHCINHQSNTPN